MRAADLNIGEFKDVRLYASVVISACCFNEDGTELF